MDGTMLIRVSVMRYNLQNQAISITLNCSTTSRFNVYGHGLTNISFSVDHIWVGAMSLCVIALGLRDS